MTKFPGTLFDLQRLKKQFKPKIKLQNKYKKIRKENSLISIVVFTFDGNFVNNNCIKFRSGFFYYIFSNGDHERSSFAISNLFWILTTNWLENSSYKIRFFFKFKLWSESIWLSRTWNVIKVRDKNSSIFLFYCHKGFKFGSLRSTITMLIFYLYIDLYVTARFDLHILVSHTIGYTFKSIGNRVFRSRIIFSN